MIQLNETIVVQTFELNQFWLVDHKFAREILTEELLQTIQIIIITKIKSQIRLFSIKIKSRIIRVVFVESSEYFSEWIVNKAAFREACSVFWISTEKYRTFREFFVFKSRLDSAKSELNDDFDQLSSSSQSLFLIDALLKILSALRKKFHRRSISLQKILLNYAIILENRHTVEYSQSIQHSQKTKTSISARKQEITTLSDDSSAMTKSTAKSSRTKKKFRETREETADEEISRMNRIIKTNLQKMLNVIVIADIAAAATTISQTASSSSEQTVSITKNRQERWNSKNIDFFDSNFDEKFVFTDETIVHAEKNTYYKDIHVFVERIKKMIIVLELEMIKKNLSFCLRESVLMWHIVELFDVFRRILFYEKNVDEWIQTLTIRFKTQAITMTINLLRERYILRDAEKNRESREYAQKIIRWAKSAKMTSSFN